MVFIQDVFLRSSFGVVGNNSDPSAEKTPDLPLKSISDLSKLWDWSGVTTELVPSIAGKYEGWNKIKTTGHPRLMCSLEKLGLVTSKTHNLVVECQGSSIGTYTTQWFNQFYISAPGHPSVLKAHMKLSEGKRKKLEYPRGVKVVRGYLGGFIYKLAQSLIYEFQTSDLPLKSISDLSKLWDWSSVTAELVPSIAGKYEGWNKIKTFGNFAILVNCLTT
ncbi:hypothetical protein B0H14DRAFT_2987283 [Mycena olivaceomarginata]|nr:hypothetical protein B0H14DRAFT_2987283 [Mycena olivaceomarginata]